MKTAYERVVTFVVPLYVTQDLFFVETQTLFFFLENGAANT